MRNKRFLSMLVVTTLSLGVFVGCSSQNQPIQESVSTETEASSTEASSTEASSTEAITEDTEEITTPELPTRELENTKIKFITWETEDQVVARPETKLFQEVYGGEIEVVTTSHEEHYTQLASLIASGLSPDLAIIRPWDWFPSAILQGLMEPVDGKIDLDSALWKDIKGVNEDARWVDGNMYGVLTGENPVSVVYYNIEMFENAGVETPGELYERDEWTLEKMGELAETMTVIDANGEVAQRGLAFLTNAPTLLGITGEPIIKKEGNTFINNIRNEKITNVMNFTSNLAQKKAVTNNAWEFMGQKAAMLFFPSWGAESDFLELTERGVIGVVPYPKYDQESEYYTISSAGGAHLVPGLQNPEGAVAYLDCMRYVSTSYYKENDPEYQDKIAMLSEEVQSANQQIFEVYNSGVKMPGVYFTSLYTGDGGINQLVDGTQNWSSVIEQVSPEIDQYIKNLTDQLNK